MRRACRDTGLLKLPQVSTSWRGIPELDPTLSELQGGVCGSRDTQGPRRSGPSVAQGARPAWPVLGGGVGGLRGGGAHQHVSHSLIGSGGTRVSVSQN